MNSNRFDNPTDPTLVHVSLILLKNTFRAAGVGHLDGKEVHVNMNPDLQIRIVMHHILVWVLSLWSFRSSPFYMFDIKENKAA